MKPKSGLENPSPFFVVLENTERKGITMKNGNCPKCQSGEVYWHKGSEDSEQITLKEAAIPVFGAFAQTTWPDKYVCVSCGYIEYYLPAAANLELVKKNWEKVAP